MHLVSIIIPCFNAEALIGDAIRSALGQSYQHAEVIVIDDGSTDESLSVIKSFGSCVHWQTGPNQGGAIARNKGLTIAGGEFIQFLDADDVLHPQKVEHQLSVLIHSDDDAVYSDWALSQPGRPGRVNICRVDMPTDDSVILALNPQNIQTNAPLHKRRTLEAIGGFRPGLPCCQERDLMLRLARDGARFSRVPGVYHTVRLQPGGVSADERRVLRCMQIVIEESFLYLQERGGLTDDRSRAFAILMARQGRRLFRYHENVQAQEYFAIAARMHPEGGLRGAYSPVGFRLARTVGPELAEWLLAPPKTFSRFLQRYFPGL